MAWGAAVVLALALCVRYDSSSEATVREEERLQSKAEVQRRLATLAAAREAPKLGGKDSQALYDVPNFTEERTRMHFPQAEAGWLDMAASGQIGDDLKSEDEQGNLTAVITEWKTKAYAEKALARSEAEVAARDENYYEYNITKGVANHKLYGAPPAPASARAKGTAPKLKGLAPQLAAARGKPSLAFRRPSLAHPQLARKLTLPARVRAEEEVCFCVRAQLIDVWVGGCTHARTHAHTHTHTHTHTSQVMEQTMAKEMAAEQRIRMFRAKMKETLHVASMKLAHQEMGWKPRKGPVYKFSKIPIGLLHSIYSRAFT